MSSTTLASDAKLQSYNNNNKKKRNNFQASYQLFKSIEKIVDEFDKKAANEPFKFNPRHEVTRSDFTKICPDFTFGVAGAAYQLEGATKEGGRGPSIWDHVCETPGKIADGSNGNIATDSYHLYKEDIKLLKSLGVDHYRFSISWSRILPSGKLSGGVNRAGVEYYNNLIDELLANGVKPFATIFHFDTPQALEDEYGGFLGDQIVDDFRDYARVCFWEFGDRVKLWATVNEPYTYCFMGYAIGGMAPFHGAPKTEADVDLSKYSNRELGKMIREVINGLREPSGQVNLLKGVVDGSEGDISDAINDLAQETSAETSRETVVHNWVKLLFGKDRTCKYYPSSRGCPSHNNSQSDDTDIGYNNDPGREPYKAAHNMILCHAAAVQVYRENFQACQKGKIGFTLLANWYEPLRVKTDKQIRDQALDFFIGWFLQPVTTGDYPETMKKIVQDRLPKFTKEQSRLLKGSCDYIGLQYYTTGYVTYGDPEPNGIPHCQYDSGSKYSVFDEDGKPIGPRCGSDWLRFYPKGIQSLLKYVKEKYNNPVIYITENGVSDLNDVSKSVSEALNDQNRIVYHKEHLYYVHKAMINDNVNVQGYFVWSLLDNFEWAAGYTVRFGMVYVDYKDACARYPKMSAYWFKNFLKGNVDDDDSTHVTPSCGAPIISTLPRRISIAPTLMAEQNDQMQITSPEDSPVANTKRSLPMLEAAESKRTKV